MHDIKISFDEEWARFDKEMQDFQNNIKHASDRMKLAWNDHLEEQSKQRQRILDFIKGEAA